MQNGHRPVVVVVDDDEAVRNSLRFLLDIAASQKDEYIGNPILGSVVIFCSAYRLYACPVH